MPCQQCWILVWSAPQVFGRGDPLPNTHWVQCLASLWIWSRSFQIHFFFFKSSFSAPYGLDRLFSYQFTETPLKKTVVSLPQGLLSGKGKLISCWAEKIPGPGRTTTGSKAASSLIRMVMLKSMNIKTHSRVFCCLENDIYWTSDCSLNCTPLGLYLPLLNQFLGELMYFIAFHGRFVLYKLNYLLITLKT